MSKIGQSPFGGGEILAQLRDMQVQLKRPSFLDHLKDNISEVNEMQKTADTMAIDLASGKSQNIHETMLAATQAELSFNLMVQVRNKILEAYQEVMRMQV
jgi:flagellar hook-basal body complex protein FliE